MELGHQLFALARFVDVLALGYDDPFGVEQRLLGIDRGTGPDGQGDGVRRPGGDDVVAASSP